MPKGERKCEPCSRWEMLQRSELIEYYKEWENRCHATNDQVFLLNSTLTRIIKSRNYFSIKLQSIVVEWSILEIIELFKKASNVGAFEEHPTLLNLFMDIESNILSLKMVVREMGSSIMQIQLTCLKFCKILEAHQHTTSLAKNWWDQL